MLGRIIPDAAGETVAEDIPAVVRSWIAECAGADASVAHLLNDRHGPNATAFTFVDAELSASSMTHGELAEASARLAGGLAGLGVGRGDRVAVLMSKRRELPVALLAIWRLGAVYVPLFTAFATPAIEMRVRDAGVAVVLTEPEQRAKLDPVEGLTVIETGPDLDELAGADAVAPVAVGADGAFVHLFTSGTTGKPKGVPIPLRAISAFRMYLHHGLDVAADDVFWNAADPGWAYGLYYGIVGPLAAGRANVLYRGGFTAAATVGIIEKLGVTNLAAAPTVYRGLIKDGVTLTQPLRRASSAGEPLTPDVTAWAPDALGTPVRDHYGQTELGMVIANGWHDDVREPVRPGSMGRPLPGFAAGILDGQIVIDVPASPLMFFTGYDGTTTDRFTPDGRWYLTGDTGRVDEDGNFFFTARDDDVIIMAGYRIGPFDVESVLVTHSGVVEAAVVGRPDRIRGEVLEAHVVLTTGTVGSAELEKELQVLVREQYSAHAYPRRVHFVEALPKTPSGKVQRFLLRRGS